MPRIYPRHVKTGLDAALDDTPVVIVVGPRQAGKSTLASTVSRERGARYITLDDEGPRAAANEDPTGFVEGSTLPLCIDEFQKAPALLPAIKARVDRARAGGERAAGMFILTGSANVWATLRISESLAGRAERVPLWPLSQGELLGLRETFIDDLFAGRVARIANAPIGRSAIADALAAGGYPEALARRDPRRRGRWFEEYVAMTLERDVRDLVRNAQQLDELPTLLHLAATRLAGLLSPTGIARDAGMSRPTVQRYLALLEQLFLLVRARAWSRNIGQRLIKAPKVWLADTGLAFQLLGYSQTRFEEDETSLAGALFENFVATEIVKQAAWARSSVRIHHFRTAGGREVDILIERADGSVCGVEVKLGATAHSRDFSALRHLQDKLGPRFKLGVVLHTGSETLSFGQGLWALPVSALWTPAAG
ncbi:MAG TPA: ATP-binding protein [Solirubrobacterales bacterium]|nr:ATP-binding protein [Solirubrobacterales bacterium]